MSTVHAMNSEQFARAAGHLMAAKMYSLASCVMIFYDIMITFGDEVERIWKRRFTGATVLWFLNRYLLPLGYIVIIVSFHDSHWSVSACERYILYPELLKIFASATIGAIFILRLYAIYARSMTILVSFSLLLVAELVVKVWAFSDGTRLHLPPGLVGCILTGKNQRRYVWTWIMELIFDTCVFIATLYRGFDLYRNIADGTALILVRIMMRDGVLYYAVIFVSNVITTLFFLAATPDLKAINASFSTLITSLMISRLMLNLRGGISTDQQSQWTRVQQKGSPPDLTEDVMTTRPDFIDTVIGNLGDPVSFWEDSQDQEHGSGETSSLSRSRSTGERQEQEGGIELTLLQHSSDPMGSHGPHVGANG